MKMKYPGAWIYRAFLTLLGGDFVCHGRLVAFLYMHPEHLGEQQSASFFGSISEQAIASKTKKNGVPTNSANKASQIGDLHNLDLDNIQLLPGKVFPF